ncbi:MAG: YigZ family protein [Lachnospiraceae bacterium]
MSKENKYYYIDKGVTCELIEKKSKFIATSKIVESEEEAILFIEEMKKKYKDARHNCSAFIVGESAQIMRCSDDGEPTQTAGKPMLEVLIGMNLTNVAVVVTRYFGGVLLGTGGLVRAYTESVQNVLRHSTLKTFSVGRQLQIQIDYGKSGKMQFLLEKNKCRLIDILYGEEVVFEFLVKEEAYEILHTELMNLTAGQINIIKEERGIKVWEESVK